MYLVRGGTPVLGKNRAAEKATELDPVGEPLASTIERKIRNSTSAEDLYDVLDDMIECDINIVGSRDYVYVTKRIKYFIEHLEKIGYISFYGNLITHSGGLRDKVKELFPPK